MKHLKYLVITLLLFTGIAYGQQKITLSSSVTQVTTDYTIVFLSYDMEKNTVYIKLKPNVTDGKPVEHTWSPLTTPTGLQVIRNSNSNDGVHDQTLESGLLAQLIKEGKIAGTVTGTPR